MTCQETDDFKASLLRETNQSNGATQALVPGKSANSFILDEIVKMILIGKREGTASVPAAALLGQSFNHVDHNRVSLKYDQRRPPAPELVPGQNQPKHHQCWDVLQTQLVTGSL